LIGSANGVAVVSAAIGSALLVVAIASASSAARRVRYRPRKLTALDARVMAAVLVAPIGIGTIGIIGDRSLRWSPSEHGLPPFHPLVAALLLALIVPTLVANAASRSEPA
jgi:UDP-N-acetylmuramyl pentapeptide phosphotransferase/UDP-N-acetylglucosamine-1-phosphate transferase